MALDRLSRPGRVGGGAIGTPSIGRVAPDQRDVLVPGSFRPSPITADRGGTRLQDLLDLEALLKGGMGLGGGGGGGGRGSGFDLNATLAGAGTGLATGAALGSLAGPIGTVVGALLGGVAGALPGSGLLGGGGRSSEPARPDYSLGTILNALTISGGSGNVLSSVIASGGSSSVLGPSGGGGFLGGAFGGGSPLLATGKLTAR